MAGLVIVVVLAAVVYLVSAPLRAGAAARAETDAELRVAELDARKEAKYREIRDAEMDFRTGKLSEADHRVMDRQLRAEAVEILRELDEARGSVPAPPAA